MMAKISRYAAWVLGVSVLWTATATRAQNFRLYVGNSGGDDISVIDLGSMKVVDDFKVGDKVHGLAVQQDGRRLFTTVESDNSLRVVDTATDKVVSVIKLTGRPNQCAVTPNGRYVAIPIRDRDAVDVVDVEQRRVVKTLPVSQPHNAFDAGSNQLIFVSSMGANQINAIDLNTMTYSAHIPVGGVPRPYVVTTDGKTLYAALSDLHGFAAIDIPHQTILQRVAMPAEHTTPHPRPFEPINTLTHGLGLTPDGRELWVTSLLDDSMYVFDLKANKVVGQVKVGDSPNWVAFTADGKYVAVSNAGSDDVSVIDVKERREVARIKVGKIPKRLVAAATGN